MRRRKFRTKHGFDNSKRHKWIEETKKALVDNFKLVLRQDRALISKKREVKYKFKNDGVSKALEAKIAKALTEGLGMPAKEIETTYTLFDCDNPKEEINEFTWVEPAK